MKRAYVVLLAIALGAALGLSAFGHRPHRAARAVAVPAEAPPITLAIEIANGSVSPAGTSVPKDHRVRLAVTNRGSAPVSLRLAGYEDLVSLAAIAPGESRTIEFLADRPGDDFTWFVDGHRSGRFVVAGSHLVGDHR